MHPAKFYPDGQMAVSTRFGDFPHYVPTTKVDDPDSLFTGWMLLSYRKPVVASSTRNGFGTAARHGRGSAHLLGRGGQHAGRDADDRPRAPKTVRAVQVDFADYQSGRFADAPDIYTEFALQASTDGQHWQEIARTEPPRRDRPTLISSCRSRCARASSATSTAMSARRISRSATFACSAMPTARRPQLPGATWQRRATRDQRDATIRWAKVPGAVGYNIRFGIRPDRLTLTHQLWADELGNGADAHQGAALAERRRSLLGRDRGVQRERRVEAQPRSSRSASRASRR